MISLVVPLFNEERTFPELWRRIDAVLSKVEEDAEIIFVDDGSTDATCSLIRALCARDPRARLVRLSRNFGHQPALTAGLDRARGDAIVLMDADLQDRPEAVAEFIREWKAGADVVYAVRSARRENVVMRVLFKSFYVLLARLSGVRQPLDAGVFSLVDRKVARILKSMPERNRYFPGLRAYAGFKQVGVPVERDARFAGEPRVGLRGLLKLALDAVFSFSYIPIRIVTCIGLVVALGAFAFLVVIFYKKFVSHAAILGWPSTLGALLLLGGLQLVMLGVVGEYVARIYDETKRRPYYVVAEQVNFDGQDPDRG